MVVLLLTALLSLAVGSRSLPTLDVLRALIASDGSDTSVIVRELRLPRTVIGLVVGAALGLAGAQLQGLTRNPLADPGLLGVSAGAALAVVSTSTVLGVGGATGRAWAALLGALLAILVGALAWRDGLTGPRLVLVGIGLGACAASLTSFLLVRAEAQRAVVWLAGSLNGRGWEHVRPVGLALLLLAPLALVLGRGLSVPLVTSSSSGRTATRPRPTSRLCWAVRCGSGCLRPPPGTCTRSRTTCGSWSPASVPPSRSSTTWSGCSSRERGHRATPAPAAGYRPAPRPDRGLRLVVGLTSGMTRSDYATLSRVAPRLAAAADSHPATTG